MEKLYIYNQELFFLSRAKSFIKKLFSLPAGGPEGVFKSLGEGLEELGVPFAVNQIPSQPAATACAVAGPKTLKWALKQKQQGLFKKVIAGPNIVIEPSEADGILKSPDIDKILVPSQWVKDCYISLAPELSPKIRVWSAGVDVPPVVDKKKDFDFLVFAKLGAASIAAQVKAFLDRENKKYCEVIYGKFKHKEYFELIGKSQFVIYLSESESQGLAMFEAWARDVPTLVWDRGFMQYGKYRWEGDTSAPYLTDACGRRFRDIAEFKKVLPEFVRQKYSARQWVENNATHAIAAKKYLEIING